MIKKMLPAQAVLHPVEGLVYIPIIDALNNRAGFGCAGTADAPSRTDA